MRTVILAFIGALSCAVGGVACAEPAVTVAPIAGVPVAPVDALACPVVDVRTVDLDGDVLDGKTIAKICVRGVTPSLATDMRNYLRSKEGKPFAVSTAATEVRALWDSGFFDDVRVMAHLLPDGRVLLDVVAVPRRPLTDVTITNVNALTREELQNLLGAQKGSFVGPSMLPSMRRRLVDEYKRRGYADTVVNLALRESGDSRVLDVDVTEGPHQP